MSSHNRGTFGSSRLRWRGGGFVLKHAARGRLGSSPACRAVQSVGSQSAQWDGPAAGQAGRGLGQLPRGQAELSRKLCDFAIFCRQERGLKGNHPWQGCGLGDSGPSTGTCRLSLCPGAFCPLPSHPRGICVLSTELNLDFPIQEGRAEHHGGASRGDRARRVGQPSTGWPRAVGPPPDVTSPPVFGPLALPFTGDRDGMVTPSLKTQGWGGVRTGALWGLYDSRRPSSSRQCREAGGSFSAF